MDILARNLWERKYLDLWTVVHLTGGMCFGFSIFFYNSPFLESFVIFVVFMIVWEILERYHQGKEPLSNQFTDVVSGAIGFLVAVRFVPSLVSTLNGQIFLFSLVYIVAWSFAYFGFRSFAIHFHPEMIEKYKKSFSSAVFLYIVIIVSVMIFS